MVMVAARGITGGTSSGVAYLGTRVGSSVPPGIAAANTGTGTMAADPADEDQPGPCTTTDTQEIPSRHP